MPPAGREESAATSCKMAPTVDRQIGRKRSRARQISHIGDLGEVALRTLKNQRTCPERTSMWMFTLYQS